MNHLVIMLSMAIAMLTPSQPAQKTANNYAGNYITCAILSVEDDILTITAEEGQTIIYMQVYDSGNNLQIESSGCYANTCYLDISDIPSGTYTCRITKRTGVCSKTFVK